MPSLYFSPEQYQAAEVFAEAGGNITGKTNYMLSAATGYQQVENDPNTPIFRAEMKLAHQFSKRLNGSLYGKYNNVASATAAGFEFTEVGVKMKWLLAAKPLFSVKGK